MVGPARWVADARGPAAGRLQPPARALAAGRSGLRRRLRGLQSALGDVLPIGVTSTERRFQPLVARMPRRTWSRRASSVVDMADDDDGHDALAVGRSNRSAGELR